MKRSKWIAKHEKALAAAQRNAAWWQERARAVAVFERAVTAVAPEIVEEVVRLRAEVVCLREELLTVTREADRLRHGVPLEGDYICPDALEVVELRAKVARLEAAAITLVKRHCEVRDEDTEYMEVHGDLLDSMSKRVYADVLRYLAEIGKVEIAIDQGHRVIARWK